MIRKRLFGGRVITVGTLEHKAYIFCSNIEKKLNKKKMDKDHFCGIGSYWGVVGLIETKLLKKQIITEENYKKFNLAIALLLIEELIKLNEIEKPVLSCFEKIIKKDFGLTSKDLKPLYKKILSVEPGLKRKLKNYSYFRY